MKFSPRLLAVPASALLALTLAACTNASSPTSENSPSTSASAMDHSHHDMAHSMDGGPAPEGIQEASNPTFPVGSKVTLTTDHMDGMKDAPATVVGAYDTTVYQVDYTPTTGGERVTNHKWVVQEELDVSSSEPLKVGDTATITADHMEGMEGAEATISGVTDQTVYMVDYESDGMTMKNHKWVTEDEMKSAE